LLDISWLNNGYVGSNCSGSQAINNPFRFSKLTEERTNFAHYKNLFRNYEAACFMTAANPSLVECIPSAALIKEAGSQRTLAGHHLDVLSVDQLPFVELKEVGNSTKVEGWHYTLLQALSRKHNFTFALKRHPSGKWGSLSKDSKSFDGILGSLVSSKDGDLALGNFFAITNRYPAVDHVNFGRGCIKLAAPFRPDQRLSMYNAVTSIFDKASWICFFGSWIAMWMVFGLIRQLEKCPVLKKRLVLKRASERLSSMDLFAQSMGNYMRKTDYKDETLLMKIFINAWAMVGFFYAGIFFKSILTQKLTILTYLAPANNFTEVGMQKLRLQYSELYNFTNQMYPEVNTQQNLSFSFIGDTSEFTESSIPPRFLTPILKETEGLFEGLQSQPRQVAAQIFRPIHAYFCFTDRLTPSL
jgi:hypothetical protein